MTTMTAPPIGDQLRTWRARRRLSQLDLALEAGVSQRHLSFIESGRSSPSREMILMLAERLEAPLRERNRMLLGAGFAPAFPEHRLDDEALAAAREAVEKVLAGHEPNPALAVDRHWNLISANNAVSLLIKYAPPEMLQPPVNVLRLSLHPDGLAPRIANLAEWRAHILNRLKSQIEASADEGLADLHRELSGYPAGADNHAASGGQDFVTPFLFQTDAGLLSLFSTTTVFGTPVDITLSELAIETFFPADQQSAALLRKLGTAPK